MGWEGGNPPLSRVLSEGGGWGEFAGNGLLRLAFQQRKGMGMGSKETAPTPSRISSEGGLGDHVVCR